MTRADNGVIVQFEDSDDDDTSCSAVSYRRPNRRNIINHRDLPVAHSAATAARKMTGAAVSASDTRASARVSAWGGGRSGNAGSTKGKRGSVRAPLRRRTAVHVAGRSYRWRSYVLMIQVSSAMGGGHAGSQGGARHATGAAAVRAFARDLAHGGADECKPIWSVSGAQ